jgi:hypothetical protein
MWGLLKAARPRQLAVAATGAVSAALLYRCEQETKCGTLCESSRPLLQQHESATPQLFCWGRLSPASSPDSAVRIREKEPLDVSFWAKQGLQVAQMSYGVSHGAALDDRGGLWAWGAETGPLPVRVPCRAKVSSLSSTQRNLYALTSSGSVLEWRDFDKQLAEASASKPLAEPRALGGALARTSASLVASGADHIIVVTRSGELVAMGDNSHGQLGLGKEPVEMPRCDEPTLIPAKLPAKAKRAACGAAHSVVVLEDGSCMSFGDDRNLQLGLRPMTIKEMKSKITRRSTPQPVELLRKRRVVDVACGGGGVEGGHTIFLTRDDEGDELYGCGYGRWGALGGKAYTHIDEPKAISTLSKLRQWDETQKRVVNIRVQALACGERHTAVLLASGNAFVWGWNDHGQLGTGSLAGTHTPQLVKSPPELRFAILKGLACGPNSTAVWS